MSKEEISLFDDQKFETDHKKFELKAIGDDGHLIKSKERVQHHGEVFTPKWIVKKMLSEPAIQEKLHDLHATFFEPSAGEGAFLKEILHQKLNYVDQISNKTTWKSNALWSLMSIYAIELLKDNLAQSKEAMMNIFVNHYQAFMQKSLSSKTDVYKSAKYVINLNIVQGNTLTYKNDDGKLITFSNWIPFGSKVEREIFTFKSLFNNSDANDIGANEGQLSLFDDLENSDGTSKQKIIITKVFRMG